MDDCLFCKIVRKEISADIIYEDDDILAFKDIKPVAPVHILIIPKKHIADLCSAQEEDALVLGKIQLLSAKIAKQFNIDETGYRFINNCRKEGGQIVYHIHYHLAGGRQMCALG